jgi:hypothetical protein
MSDVNEVRLRGNVTKQSEITDYPDMATAKIVWTMVTESLRFNPQLENADGTRGGKEPISTFISCEHWLTRTSNPQADMLYTGDTLSVTDAELTTFTPKGGERAHTRVLVHDFKVIKMGRTGKEARGLIAPRQQQGQPQSQAPAQPQGQPDPWATGAAPATNLPDF